YIHSGLLADILRGNPFLSHLLFSFFFIFLNKGIHIHTVDMSVYYKLLYCTHQSTDDPVNTDTKWECKTDKCCKERHKNIHAFHCSFHLRLCPISAAVRGSCWHQLHVDHLGCPCHNRHKYSRKDHQILLRRPSGLDQGPWRICNVQSQEILHGLKCLCCLIQHIGKSLELIYTG